MRFSNRSLRVLKNLHAIPSAERVARTIIGETSEPSSQHAPYSLGPFSSRPIHFASERPNGWIRQFSGDLRVEHDTGLIYDGFRPIYNSTDGLHANSPFLPPTKPISMLRQDCVQVEKAIILWTTYQRSYYHFMVDVVPKMEIIERAGISHAIPVIVTGQLASLRFYKEAKDLGLFGDREVITQKSRQCIKAKQLYVVRPDAYTERQLNFPSQRLGVRPDPLCRERIYVSRGAEAALNRRILNEEELTARLRPLGFSVINTGKMPLAEQIQRFSRAGIVVGPHGSGLVNILFRYGAPLALVEMINDTKIFIHHFFSIATHCGFFYRATLNRAEPGDEERAPAHADIEAVLAAVEEAIAWEKSN